MKEGYFEIFISENDIIFQFHVCDDFNFIIFHLESEVSCNTWGRKLFIDHLKLRSCGDRWRKCVWIKPQHAFNTFHCKAHKTTQKKKEKQKNQKRRETERETQTFQWFFKDPNVTIQPNSRLDSHWTGAAQGPLHGHDAWCSFFSIQKTLIWYAERLPALLSLCLPAFSH